MCFEAEKKKSKITYFLSFISNSSFLLVCNGGLFKKQLPVWESVY